MIRLSVDYWQDSKIQIRLWKSLVGDTPTVWTVSYSNQIPSGYAQNRIWADSLNEAQVFKNSGYLLRGSIDNILY